jgi:hypothetical protein
MEQELLARMAQIGIVRVLVLSLEIRVSTLMLLKLSGAIMDSKQ